MELKQLRKEILEKEDGRFEFLNPLRINLLPEEQAILLRIEYVHTWRRTAEKWGNFCLDQLRKEHPEVEFSLIRYYDKGVGIFEAVIKVG